MAADAAPRRRGRPPGPPLDLDARRELLLDAAESVIRSSGADVGLAEVAKAAGLTRSAVYAAFADREAVIEALAVRHAGIIVQRLTVIVAKTADPAAQTRAAVDILAAWFDDEPQLARLLTGRLGSTGSGGPGAIVTAVAEILREGFRARGGDETAAEPWAHALVGAVASTVGWWSRTRSMPRTEVVDHLFHLIWSGFEGAGGARVGSP